MAFVTTLAALPRTRRRAASARCAPRMAADPSGVNAGEAYIRDLARQSTENARKRSQQPSTPAAPPKGVAPRAAYEHGAHNAGEEYIRQLSNGAAPPPPPPKQPPQAQRQELTPEMQARIAAMRAATAPNADTPARRTIDAAEEARRRILAELDALGEGGDEEEEPAVASLDDEIAAIEAQLAAKGSAPLPPPPPPPAAVPEATATASAGEVEQLRMGMIEMRMEVEKYASEMRKLHEKHEQMMRLIVERYMPGL